MKTLLLSCKAGDWSHVNERVFTCSRDLNIRIETGETAKEIFHEDWAKQFPSEDPRRVDYTLWYASSPIKEYGFVVVDGGRASLPMPRIGTMDITREQLLIADAVNFAHVEGPGTYYNRYISRFNVVG